MGTTESMFYDDASEGSYSASHQYAPRSSMSESGNQTRGRPQSSSHARRRRQRVSSSSSALLVEQLDGLILGLPSSGKRTLVQRLEGKDPFKYAHHQQDQTPNRVLVPYQAPTKDRIQLRIQVATAVPPPADNSTRDFVVILIHPGHNPDQIHDYLRKSIHSLLQGMQEQSHRSLCICLLLNFRDKADTENEKVWRQQDAVLQGATTELLKDYPNTMLQMVTGSLFNCYGLATLHHFIYRAFLQRQADALLTMQQQLQIQQESAQKLCSQEPYADFLKHLPNGSSHERRPKSQKQRRRVIGNAKHERESSATATPTESKAVKHEPAVTTTPSVKGKDARHERDAAASSPPKAEEALSPQSTDLEAFLASSDEEEGEVMGRRPTVSEDSDGDDDDFFYDVHGNRVQSKPTDGNEIQDDASSSKEDGDNVEGSNAADSPSRKSRSSDDDVELDDPAASNGDKTDEKDDVKGNPRPIDNDTTERDETGEKGGGGISAAAMSAIANAQREAEAMLEEDLPKKKKKHKKKKKKKT